MVRCMCGVSLKLTEGIVRIYARFVGINCPTDPVVRRGRLRWFGHLERKSVDALGVSLHRVGGGGGEGSGQE